MKNEKAKKIASIAKSLKDELVAANDYDNAADVRFIEKKYDEIVESNNSKVVMGVDRDILNGTGAWSILRGDKFIASGVIDEPCTKISFDCKISKIADLFNVDQIVVE
jgi:hypothetical protein